jgi:hypothetical protein
MIDDGWPTAEDGVNGLPSPVNGQHSTLKIT